MAYLGNTPAARFSAMQYQDLTGVTGSPVKRGFTLSHSVGSEKRDRGFCKQRPSGTICSIYSVWHCIDYDR